jgi:hypothetical protein
MRRKACKMIQVAGRSVAWVWSHFIAGIAGSNLAVGREINFIVFVVCCMGGDLCVLLIMESYRSTLCVWFGNFNTEVA